MTDRLLLNRIERVLDDVSGHTGYGGIFHALSGNALPLIGRGVCRFCSSCAVHSTTASFCRSSACTSAIQGHAIGDVWYFRCWLGFDSLAIAIAPKGEIVGAIEVGGFFSPGGSEEAQQTILARVNTLAPGSLERLSIGALQGVRELEFKQVKGIADFLAEATFAAGLNVAAQFEIRHRIHRQQQRLALRMQEIGDGQAFSHTEILGRLIPLVGSIRRPDSGHALGDLDNFLGSVLLHCQGDPGRAKAALLVLAAAMFREDVDAGEEWRKSILRFEQRLIDLEKMETTEDAFIWIEDVVAKAAGSAEKTGGNRSSGEIAGRVLDWLAAHYRKKVTIADAADAVASSPSAITHRLKVETAKTFTEHLTAMRVSEAKRLLVYTNMSLSEVAAHCGFADQSYFTKVFRRLVNMTPGEFRGMLDRA